MAIMVNNIHSYPPIAQSMHEVAHPLEPVFSDLADAVRGDWPPLSEHNLASYADLVLGTYAETVTAAYTVESWSSVTNDAGTPKLVFDVSAALDWIHLIGQPQPGGAWRRGESRGTRRIDTPGLGEPTTPGSYTDWRLAVVTAARTLCPPSRTTPAEDARPVRRHDVKTGDISTTIRPDGSILVSVPAGVPVTIQPR